MDEDQVSSWDVTVTRSEIPVGFARHSGLKEAEVQGIGYSSAYTVSYSSYMDLLSISLYPAQKRIRCYKFCECNQRDQHRITPSNGKVKI